MSLIYSGSNRLGTTFKIDVEYDFNKNSSRDYQLFSDTNTITAGIEISSYEIPQYKDLIGQYSASLRSKLSPVGNSSELIQTNTGSATKDNASRATSILGFFGDGTHTINGNTLGDLNVGISEHVNYNYLLYNASGSWNGTVGNVEEDWRMVSASNQVDEIVISSYTDDFNTQADTLYSYAVSGVPAGSKVRVIETSPQEQNTWTYNLAGVRGIRQILNFDKNNKKISHAKIDNTKTSCASNC